MRCPKCKSEAVKADAGFRRSVPFWYCRTCKEEVDDTSPMLRDAVDFDLLAEFERLIREIEIKTITPDELDKKFGVTND